MPLEFPSHRREELVCPPNNFPAPEFIEAQPGGLGYGAAPRLAREDVERSHRRREVVELTPHVLTRVQLGGGDVTP
jgi:hypothetical protein